MARRFVSKSRSIRSAKNRAGKTHNINLKAPPRGGTRL